MADNLTPIEHVSDTALWVATFRAREGRRKKPLFRDPYAGILAGERGEWIARTMERSRYIAWTVVIRTVIIDAYIAMLIAEGADAVLNLGAGLDTRPYRLDLPSDFQWFEVDYEPILALKNEKLRGTPARCALERWAVDLNDAKAREALLAQVSERARNVIVLTEGVVPYLAPEQVADLAKALRRFPSMKHWIADYMTSVVKPWLTGRHARQMRNAPFQFFVDDWHGFHAGNGWKAREVRYYGDESSRLGRQFPMPLWAMPFMLLASKNRRRAIGRLAGYALLEPKN